MPNNLIQLMSVMITAIASSGAVAAIFNRRNKAERQADVDQRHADTDNISAQAAATALTALRGELVAANEDLERRRKVIQGQDERIDKQQDQIRRLRRQVGTLQDHGRLLENWIRGVAPLLDQLNGTVPPLPALQWPARSSDQDIDDDL